MSMNILRKSSMLASLLVVSMLMVFVVACGSDDSSSSSAAAQPAGFATHSVPLTEQFKGMVSKGIKTSQGIWQTFSEA